MRHKIAKRIERITFDEALEQIKAESPENRALIEECERKAVLLNEAESKKEEMAVVERLPLVVV